MNAKKSSIIEKSGYLEFSYVQESDPKVAAAYEAGLSAITERKLLATLLKSTGLNIKELETITAELSNKLSKQAVFESSNAYGEVTRMIAQLAESLPKIVEDSGPLKTPAARSAFKGALLSRLSLPRLVEPRL